MQFPAFLPPDLVPVATRTWVLGDVPVGSDTGNTAPPATLARWTEPQVVGCSSDAVATIDANRVYASAESELMASTQLVDLSATPEFRLWQPLNHRFNPR